MEEWDLSAEDLDSLERDAVRQIAQRNSSTSTSSSTNPKIHAQSQPFTSRGGFNTSPCKPLPRPSPTKQVDAASSGSRILPTSIAPKLTDDCSKEQRKLSVKFFVHASGNIAVKFPYDQALVNAIKKIPKASWNAKERLWIFPMSSLSAAEKVLGEVPGSKVEVNI